ncbi:MAG: hypothetical protein WBM84_14045, partial [Sedimenticolaceae bacterium]
MARQPAIEAAIFSGSIDLHSPYVSDILMIMTDSDTDDEAAIKPVNGAPLDRGEPVSLMEPMRISESSRHRGELNDLAVELAAHSAGFRRSLPAGVLP